MNAQEEDANLCSCNVDNVHQKENARVGLQNDSTSHCLITHSPVLHALDGREKHLWEAAHHPHSLPTLHPNAGQEGKLGVQAGRGGTEDGRRAAHHVAKFPLGYAPAAEPSQLLLAQTREAES